MVVPANLIGRLGTPLNAPRNEVRFCCPVCLRNGKKSPDTKYHLYYNTRKRMFICQRCKAAGTLTYLYFLIGVDPDKPSLVGWEDSMARTIRTLRFGQLAEEEEESGPAYCPEPEMIRPIRWEGEIRFYLAKRGVTPEIAEWYGLGDGLGDLRGRIVCPDYERVLGEDELRIWVARAYTLEMLDLVNRNPRQYRKYEFPIDSRKSRWVYNYDRVRRAKFDHVVITEGVFDAISTGKNGVAILGSRASAEQYDMLLQLGKHVKFSVALDPDALQQSIEICQFLFSHEREARLVTLPQNEDPSSLGPEMQRHLDQAIDYDPFRTGIELMQRQVI